MAANTTAPEMRTFRKLLCSTARPLLAPDAVFRRLWSVTRTPLSTKTMKRARRQHRLRRRARPEAAVVRSAAKFTRRRTPRLTWRRWGEGIFGFTRALYSLESLKILIHVRPYNPHLQFWAKVVWKIVDYILKSTVILINTGTVSVF